MKHILTGFHGTDSANEASILATGFETSIGDNHWLGDGIYFFVEGNSGVDPVGAAVKWAIAQAYDKLTKRNRYSEYVVLEAEIEVEEENFLDLNTVEGMRVFNRIRNGFINKIEAGGYKLKSGAFQDGHLINLARTELKLPIYVVRGDFYIKFQIERIENINFRIPNCTIISVLCPDSLMDLEKVKINCKRKII